MVLPDVALWLVLRTNPPCLKQSDVLNKDQYDELISYLYCTFVTLHLDLILYNEFFDHP